MNRRALRDRYPSHHHPLPEYNFQDGRSATTPVERLKAMISGLGDPKVQAVLHDDMSSSFSEG